MTFTAIIAINAFLDLAVILAVGAIVYLSHRMPHDAATSEAVSPSVPLRNPLALSANRADELAHAA